MSGVRTGHRRESRRGTRTSNKEVKKRDRDDNGRKDEQNQESANPDQRPNRLRLGECGATDLPE